MPNIGMSELIVVLMILLLVFGASRLPALGEGMGRAIRNFKRGIASDDRITVRDAGGEPGRPGGDVAKAKGAKAGDVEDAELLDRKA